MENGALQSFKDLAFKIFIWFWSGGKSLMTCMWGLLDPVLFKLFTYHLETAVNQVEQGKI